tara:strand:- start:458 stop:1186 length:729 start_codon:yes stop_codon:yes gene_type:complete
MQKILVFFLVFFLAPIFLLSSEPIYHKVQYPTGDKKFPAVILLHTSGGFKTVLKQIPKYIKKGFAVYAPDFFKKHGISSSNRMETFDEYREPIEKELLEIVALMKKDPKIDKNNIFAAGFSNGGFWACFLAGKGVVNAGASHYGVWKANFGPDMTNEYPMEYFSKKSTPLLALHGDVDSIQKIEFAQYAWIDIKDRGGKIVTHVLQNAGHAWDSNKSIFVYNKKADKDALKKTVRFFRKHSK